MLPHSLHKLPFVERFYSHHVTGSTNDIARSMRELPVKGIFVIQADRQTAGRGRSGASYFSDTEGGLWASIVTPVGSLNEHFVHNRALSLAICEAVEQETGRPGACTIKWPNDIYWGDRKLCGMLLENHLLRSDILVIGFGVNIKIKTADFPAGLQAIATSLFMETEKEFSRRSVLEKILERYDANLMADLQKTHYAYSGRLYGLGLTAEIEGSCGVFAGVEMDGRLKLTVGRETKHFVSGHLKFPKASESGHG
ncbi:MAG: biotin--[acetyl-CoA-carboxylase] ligase [Chitinispirillaceae bacterium]|nr:biotin--[acetyl-CoA-carboxylase] ligase [Chitinispirillaceae bacterium]